jgi:hypothetical protein
VYKATDRSAIMGLLITKELIRFVGPMNDTGSPIQVGSLPMRDLPHLPVTTPMFDLLNLFQTGHSHMALLVAASGDGPARGCGEEGGQGEGAPAALIPKRSFADKLRSSLKRIHLALLPEEEGEGSEGDGRKTPSPTSQRSPRHSVEQQQETHQQQQQKLADTELQIPQLSHKEAAAAAADGSHVALTIPNGGHANGHTGYEHMPASELDAALELGRQCSSERRAASVDDLAMMTTTAVPTSTAVMVADAVAAALADSSSGLYAAEGGDASVKAGSVGAGGSEAGSAATAGGREGRRKRRKEGIMRSTPLLPHPNMVPVGIITLEDVMEELMQVRRGGVQPRRCVEGAGQQSEVKGAVAVADAAKGV